MIKFFKSVINEMKLVSWPSGKQWRKDVLIVIEMALLFVLFFAVSDVVLSYLIGLLVK